MSLYIVGTPIGNLKDITLRALEVLREVNYIAAEDTRVTKKLLSHYEIRKPLISYREQVHKKVSVRILALLSEGKSVALVSDAGTPTISDPGYRLISDARSAGHKIISIPGPSALTAALSVSGVSADKFIFLGFPPHKKGRESFFKEVSSYKHPVVMYESPHRLLRTLGEIENHLKERGNVILIKELTKIYENVISGPISKVIAEVKSKNKNYIKGEFVIIIGS